MGQDKMHRFLMDNPDWHTAKQIANKLNTEPDKITEAGKKLARFGFIERRLVKNKLYYEYKVK